MQSNTARLYETHSNEIAAMYNGGLTTHEIAKKFSTYPAIIARILKKCGIKMRGPGRRKQGKAEVMRCNKCGRVLSSEMFIKNKRNSSGRDPTCKECHNAKLVNKKKYLRKYRMSIKDYNRLLAKQGGRCAICGVMVADTLHVDHCHETGRVRGLLCRNCNFGLGMFEDQYDRLIKAAKYISQK